MIRELLAQTEQDVLSASNLGADYQSASLGNSFRATAKNIAATYSKNCAQVRQKAATFLESIVTADDYELLQRSAT